MLKFVTENQGNALQFVFADDNGTTIKLAPLACPVVEFTENSVLEAFKAIKAKIDEVNSQDKG